MIAKRGVGALRECCRRKTLNRFLEHYIRSCRDTDTEGGGSTKKRVGRFPNLAGFCRYFHISLEDIDAVALEFPQEMAYLYAILEDEALNSGLPPAVLSAYLKKRLGYDKELPAEDGTGVLNIHFEHNIYDDGE